jgi:hypothetical protein
MSAGESAKTRSDQVRCKRCDAALAHKILNVRTGGSLRMYKCACDEQVWVELPVE